MRFECRTIDRPPCRSTLLRLSLDLANWLYIELHLAILIDPAGDFSGLQQMYQGVIRLNLKKQGATTKKCCRGFVCRPQGVFSVYEQVIFDFGNLEQVRDFSARRAWGTEPIKFAAPVGAPSRRAL
jgi:hypothetical protein